jgi:hypothetical protein
MAAARPSNDINAEILAFGPSLFKAVRSAVRERATLPARDERGSTSHRENQHKLDRQIEHLLLQTHPDRGRGLDDAALWSLLWGRIAYAGTRASKASAEIASMPQVPLFADHATFDPVHHRFDKKEWTQFRKHWKERQKTTSAGGPWLVWAKSRAAEWADSLAKGFRITTPEILQLMTHSDPYAEVSFSAHEHKMEKYLAVAAFLNSAKAKAYPRIIEYYTAGAVFGDRHPEGDDYTRESALRRRVQDLFARQVGRITALHAMMDLGLRTVKPDRVITWLFSQLGWLQTLPETLEKDTVLSLYTDPCVVEEVLARTDVLAAVIATEDEPHTHRLIDIWFVKYGQEPESDYGITVNLQTDEPGGVRTLYDRLRADAGVVALDPVEAHRRWPIPDFEPLHVDDEAPVDHPMPSMKRRAPRRLKRIVPRDEAERRFMDHWHRGRDSSPDLYPRRFDNDPKETIIHLIECGWDPQAAFLSALRPETDESKDDVDE